MKEPTVFEWSINPNTGIEAAKKRLIDAGLHVGAFGTYLIVRKDENNVEFLEVEFKGEKLTKIVHHMSGTDHAESLWKRHWWMT